MKKRGHLEEQREFARLPEQKLLSVMYCPGSKVLATVTNQQITF